jgi:hypothetical protein
MRNGVYRVWIKGLGRPFSGVAALKDGELFAADRQFVYNGRVSKRGGWLTSAVKVKRIYCDMPSAPFAGLDTMHVKLEGHAGREFAQLVGAIEEAPDVTLSVEFAFLSEA